MIKNKKRNLFKKILLTITACFIAVFSVFGLTYNSNISRTVSAAETEEPKGPSYWQVMYSSSTYSFDVCNNNYNDYTLYSDLQSGSFYFRYDIHYAGRDGFALSMYADHLVTTMGTSLHTMVWNTASDNPNNTVTFTRGLLDYDWYCLDNPFRVVDRYYNDSYGVVVGFSVDYEGSNTPSFFPYYTYCEKLDFSSFQAKDTSSSDNNIRNQPFSATVLNAFTNNLSSAYFKILKFTTVFTDNCSLSFYFLCSVHLPVDTSPKYFYGPNASEEFTNGYNAGYNAGFELGNTQGYDTGYSEGYDLGESNGYQNGYNDGVNTNNSGAFQEGYNRGYNTGKNDGYVIGKEESAEGKYTFTHLITAVIDVPINSFKSLFEFEILGVDLSGFFLGLLTCCVIVAVIRFIL